jgi:hypothetical protein
MNAAAAHLDTAVGGVGERSKAFRPSPRRRARIAIGLALASAAVGGNVLLYSSLDDTQPVLQLTNDVRAGEVLEVGDLRVVDAKLDPTVPFVAAADLSSMIGHVARVHLSSGTLLASHLVQAQPLVSAGASVVAIAVAPTRVPAGLRERSRVALVIPGPAGETVAVEGRVVASVGAQGAGSSASMSVEVAATDATTVAAAEDVRVVLLEPAADPAMTTTEVP